MLFALLRQVLPLCLRLGNPASLLQFRMRQVFDL